MDRREWTRQLIEALESLANYDYQLRVWIRGLGPEEADCNESLCVLFNGLAFDLFMSRPDVVTDVALVTALRRVRVLTNPDSILAESVEKLNSPEWAEIRDAASVAMRELARWDSTFSD
jgi:hypothetical protein